MGLILQVLGILFLLVVVLIIVAVFVVKAKLKGALSSLADLKYTVIPPRVHLRREETPDWHDPEGAVKLIEAVRSCGFQESAFYHIEEMDYVRLTALTNEESRVYSVVYEHDKAGVWVDFVARYEDGTALTYSTARQGGELEQRPGDGKVYAPDLEPPVLYQRILREMPQRPLASVSGEQFPATFEKAYADEMDWRNSRGGVSEEEIRAIAAASGDEVTEEMIAEIREQKTSEAYESLSEGLTERFLAQTDLSAAEWEKVRERLVFIYDTLPPGMVWDLYLSSGWDEEKGPSEDFVKNRVRETSPREAFAEMNEKLPEERRFNKIGRIAEPLVADVYVSPVIADDEDFGDDDD